MEKQIKAILVDDEEGARNVLSKLITKFCPEIEIVAHCEDLLSAKTEIEAHKPDVVFLDIEMPNYAGYEIVKFFDTINFQIVFVTAYENYAIKAFEISAFDYLLKPVEVNKLRNAVKRLVDNKELHNIEQAYNALKENLKENKVKKIVLRKNTGSIVAAISDIIAIQAQLSYCTIITLDGEYTTSKNLKYYQLLLEDEPDFFRSHKSWIINKQHIEQFSKSSLEIKLAKGIEAKLSKYKIGLFEEFMLM